MNDYSEIAQNELEKLEQYKMVYAVTHPYPDKERISFWKELGLEAGALIASALGSIILSAIRTSTIFMLTEALLIAAFDRDNIIPKTITSSFPVMSMIVSLVAFEGMLSAHGFIRGKASAGVEISPIAMWLCFGVTITAGLSASFGLLGLNSENTMFILVSWILAILTAIGAPVVAYYGSMNLGVILNKWAKIKSKSEQKYEADVRSWNTSYLGSFRSKSSRQLFGQRTEQERTTERETIQPVRSELRANERKEQIWKILDSHFSGNGRNILGTSEIAKILAMQANGSEDITGYENYKGYVHSVRKEWMEYNGLS